MLVQQYTRLQTVIANIPYSIMILLGAVIISLGSGFSLTGLIGATGYILYGIAGSAWTMIFICPYCAYYATRSCPCGYGMLSARMVRRGEGSCFSEKFRRHIPVLVPLWFIPVICGGIALWYSPSWVLAGALLVFSINSFVVLPLVSRKHSCSECPQKDDCPWMSVGIRKDNQRLTA